MNKYLLGLTLFFGLMLFSSTAQAQEAVTIGGTAYMDYSYILASPDSEEEGDNGFGYRRAYLTADYTLSETFSGRLRFESVGTNATPFVKDLYLKWKNVAGDGSQLQAGVTSPPSFVVSEKFYGYRSLEKTIMDRVKVVSSRDMGVYLGGNLVGDGTLKYALMVGNNNSTKDENDRYKRFYGQLEFYPTKALTLTLGGDYASGKDSDGFNVNAFAGYKMDAVRVGVEGFFNQVSYDEVAAKVEGEDTLDKMGVSVFAIAKASDNLEGIVRFDYMNQDKFDVETNEAFVMAGLAYIPHKQVKVIPNVLYSKYKDTDAHVAGRITLSLDF